MSRGANSINNSRKCNTLWVGDLEPEIDEKYLRNVFGQNQNVKSIHIYKDKITNGKVNYAFLEFETPDIAEQVLHLFNGKDKPRYGKPFKINWGNQKSRRERPQNMFGMNQYQGRFQGMQPGFGRMVPMVGVRGVYPPLNMSMMPPVSPPFKSGRRLDPPNMFSIYVGDLDQFCEHQHLADFFKPKYQSVIGAKVIKDFATKKNKGFGFVHFEDPNESEKAIREMNGAMFMGRRIKTGRSFSKNNMNQNRGPMVGMVGRRMPYVPMQVGMGRPYSRGAFPPQGPSGDQNSSRNTFGKKGPHSRPVYLPKRPKVDSPNNSRKGSLKQPNYVISTTRETRERNKKREAEKGREREREREKGRDRKEERGKEPSGDAKTRRDNLDDTKDKSENNSAAGSEIPEKEQQKIPDLQAQEAKNEGKAKSDLESKKFSGGLLNKRAEMNPDDSNMII